MFFWLVIPGYSTALCTTGNYNDELLLANFNIVNSSLLADGQHEVEISAEIENIVDSELEDVIASFDFSESTLDVVLENNVVPSLSFSSVSSFESKTSSTNLTVKLPSVQVDELLSQLNAGVIPLRVNGSERTVFRPDVKKGTWLSNADAAFITADDQTIENRMPTNFSFSLTAAISGVVWECPETEEPKFIDGQWQVGTCHVVLPDNEPFYVYESLESGLVSEVGINGKVFPVEYRQGIIELGSYSYLPPMATGGSGNTIIESNFTIRLIPPETDLTAIIKSGRYCSDERSFLEQPVAQTRHVMGLDNYEPLPEEPVDEVDNKYRDVQPFRFNNLDVGGVSVSGQVQGFALKPSLSISFRPNLGTGLSDIILDTSIKNDANIALQLTAEEDIALIDQQDIRVGALCFPMPPIPVGILYIPWSLHFTQDLSLEASFKAGMTMGIEKQFSGEYDMSWDTGKAEPFSFHHKNYHKPIEFTPPRLVDDTAADASAAINFRSTIIFADYLSLCNTGIGPYINARVGGNLHVSPVEDPWWVMGHEAELSAGISFDFLGLTILDTSAELIELPSDEFISSNSTGKKSAQKDPETDISSGKDQRWAINVDDISSEAGKIWETDLAATADGGAVVIASNVSNGGSERLIRLDPEGQVLWDKQLAGITKIMVATEVLEDGRIMTAGKEGAEKIWLAQHSADGEELWNRSYFLKTLEGNACKIKQLNVFTDTAGDPGYIISGTSGSTTNNTARPCLMRLNEAGDVVWSKTALQAQVSNTGDISNWTLYNLLVTRDGGFLFMGTHYVRPPGDFASTEPVAVKVDEDGNVQWHIAFELPTGAYRKGYFYAATQAEDGQYYFTGKAGGTVSQTGGFLVATLSQDGKEGQGAVLNYHKFDLGGTDDFNSEPNHWSNIYQGGTPWDTGFDIAAVKGGAVMVGSMGTAVSSGLGDEAWVIRVNKYLGVEWFTSYDGSEYDTLTRLVKTEDGLLAAGMTRSIEENNGTTGKTTLLVMKIPFEGLVGEFKDSLDYFNRYALPTVFQGPETYANNPAIKAYTPIEDYQLREGVVTDLASVDTFLQTPTSICVQRLTLNNGVDSPLYPCDVDDDGFNDLIDNCPLISNPDRIDLDDDSVGDVCDLDIDGDGLPNAWEELYSLNPLEPSDALSSADNDTLTNLEEFNAGTIPTEKDSDGDGSNDDIDLFPLDTTEWLDSDEDGIGDNSDPTPFPPAGKLTFNTAAMSISENSQSIQLVVERLEGSYGTVNVDYQTEDVSATAGEDYLARSGSLSLFDGETSSVVTISILDDDKYESDETFIVKLLNPQGATLGDKTILEATIDNDDPDPSAENSESKKGGVFGRYELFVFLNLLFINMVIRRLKGRKNHPD